MPVVKAAAALVIAVLAAYLVGFETIYFGSRALDRVCKSPSESCALSSPFVAFFGLVTGAETFLGVLSAGALRIGGRVAAAWIVVCGLTVVLVAEHVWLLS